MKIAVGSDHAGLGLKNEVVGHLKEKGVEFKDFGTYTMESCDYPNFGEKVATEVAKGNYDLGILVCGTGIGISIAANKVPGIRAANCSDTFSAHACREHNNANILALGERIVGVGVALDIVDSFLGATFEGGRHAARVNMISGIEKKYNK